MSKCGNKCTVKVQGYAPFQLDSGDFSCRDIGRVFRNLKARIVVENSRGGGKGTPKLVLEMKVGRYGQICYLPLYGQRGREDSRHNEKKNCKRISLCNMAVWVGNISLILSTIAHMRDPTRVGVLPLGFSIDGNDALLTCISRI